MRWLERTLCGIGIALLGLCAWSWLDAGLYQTLQGRRLGALLGSLSRDGSGASLPGGIASITRAQARKSGLVGRITVERLGIDAVVAEGTLSRTLRRAVGHVSGTAFPGEPGNVALAGHRDTFFSGLRGVRTGDRIDVTTPDGRFEYRVVSRTVVGPDRGEVLAASDSPTLTLITCFPFQYVGPAPGRFIVRARQALPARPD